MASFICFDLRGVPNPWLGTTGLNMSFSLLTLSVVLTDFQGVSVSGPQLHLIRHC